MKSYSIDNSAILYLAQMGDDHSNVYRFSMVMAEPVRPELLQQAADRICPRFPTILAGFRPGPFTYSVVPVEKPPVVSPDPGMLHTMTPAEMARSAYRIYYDGCRIYIEAFHALTDGYGAVASIQALLGEYVYLHWGVNTPERQRLLESPPDWEEELKDAYLDYPGKQAGSLPRRNSYQLPGRDMDGAIHDSLEHLSTQALRRAAKAQGASVTTLLTTLMAETVMELQRKLSGHDRKPVRIMVPIDLRRQFPSRTFRNFILYALPTLEPEEADLPRQQRMESVQAQLRRQTEKPFLASQIGRNVRLQALLPYRWLPREWKNSLMRLSYRFFGECNSSITLTNLGPAPLSEELRQYLRWIDVYLTPRRHSPYNCGLLSCGDVTSICITRFGGSIGLEETFFAKLRSVLDEQ